MSHPGRDARGPRTAPPDRHGRPHHLGDLPPYSRDGAERGRAPADHSPRLLTAPHGLSRAITIGWDTFTRYCKDVGSLARHGFKRMLFLNGHGSNQPFVDAAARLVGVDHPDVLAGSAFYLSGGKALERIEEIRDSDAGGMAHACELRDVHLPRDRPGRGGNGEGARRARLPCGMLLHGVVGQTVRVMPWWSAFSVTGIQGDASKARPRRARRFWLRRSRSASASSATCSPSPCPSDASRGDAVTPPPIPMIAQRAATARSAGRSAPRRPARWPAWSRRPRPLIPT